MKTRLLLCTALSSSFATSTLLAGAAYQQSLDRKDYIWNSNYDTDQAVLWSGKHDSQRLATGQGNVAYYKVKRFRGLGASVPEQYTLIVRYHGTMVRGKLQGVVTKKDERGELMHADFVDGVRQSDWQPGLGTGKWGS
jgi:Ni/Co efflux regulator RcnB